MIVYVTYWVAWHEIQLVFVNSETVKKIIKGIIDKILGFPSAIDWNYPIVYHTRHFMLSENPENLHHDHSQGTKSCGLTCISSTGSVIFSVKFFSLVVC